MRTSYLALGVLGLGVLLVSLYSIRSNIALAPKQAVTNFEECINAGYPVMESYPRQCRVPEGELFSEKITPVPNTEYTPFEEAVTLRINETVEFRDGLKVTPIEINDSRCAPDVQCIWAGELSALFRVMRGDSMVTPTEVRLGTTNNQSTNLGEYTFTLTDASPSDVTFTITKNTSVGVNNMGFIKGNVIISPICPVERVDEPCEVKPEVYTSRNVVVYESNGTTVSAQVALDATGNYSLSLPVGIYFIQIKPAGIGEGEKKEILVRKGETQTLNFDIDSGIR